MLVIGWWWWKTIEAVKGTKIWDRPPPPANWFDFSVIIHIIASCVMLLELLYWKECDAEEHQLLIQHTHKRSVSMGCCDRGRCVLSILLILLLWLLFSRFIALLSRSSIGVAPICLVVRFWGRQLTIILDLISVGVGLGARRCSRTHTQTHAHTQSCLPQPVGVFVAATANG